MLGGGQRQNATTSSEPSSTAHQTAPHPVSRGPNRVNNSGTMIALWHDLTSSERRELEAQLQPLFEGQGDHTRLRILNNTKKKVDSGISSNAGLGAQPESLAGAPISSVTTVTTNRLQEKAQADAWRAANADYQRMLHALGYYDGKIDGTIGPQTLA